MLEFTREKRLRTRSENGTVGLGEIMTELLTVPKLVVLRGELGMGKTTLVRGMAMALGANADDVSSPTFTLVHEYKGRKTRLFHLDNFQRTALRIARRFEAADHFERGLIIRMTFRRLHPNQNSSGQR